MKKTVLTAGGFIALAVLCYVGRLSGQQQPPAAATTAATPRTRIALLNITYVIKNYVKYQRFQQEIKGVIEPFQKRDTELRQRLDNLRKEAESAAHTGGQVQRDELERRAKDIQRQLEDNSAEAKLKLGKRSDDEMKTLFLDVYEAAQRYAASHDFELVLHYNDALTQEDFFSSQNIARKLNTGALMPLITPSTLEISKDLVGMLNAYVNSGATPTGATQSAPPAGGQH